MAKAGRVWHAVEKQTKDAALVWSQFPPGQIQLDLAVRLYGGGNKCQLRSLTHTAIQARITASHPNSEVKLALAGVVLWWGTTWEGPVLCVLFVCSFAFLRFGSLRLLCAVRNVACPLVCAQSRVSHVWHAVEKLRKAHGPHSRA